MARVPRRKAVDVALDAVDAEKRRPDEDDAPAKPSTFPGKPVPLIPGQLSLDDVAEDHDRGDDRLAEDGDDDVAA